MTNKNDTIFYIETNKGPFPVKAINLTELAETTMRKEIVGQPEITGWNNGVKMFLEKIREAMK